MTPDDGGRRAPPKNTDLTQGRLNQPPYARRLGFGVDRNPVKIRLTETAEFGVFL